MLILSGTLRQSGQVTFKEKTMLKVWLEHESPRDNGPADLRLEELFLPVEDQKSLPVPGSQIAVCVRAYPSGRNVAFAGLHLLTQNSTSVKGE